MIFFMVRRWISTISLWSSAPSRTVGGAALIIAVAGIASRFLGFLRDRILASQFGAGDVLDSYYAAFRIPDFIYNLLVLGALSAAFIPVFTELFSKHRDKQAWRLASGVLHLLLFVIGCLALIGFVFAPWLTQGLALGFTPDKQAAVSMMTRIMLISPLFLSVSAVFGGVLVSFRRFTAYSFAPMFYNVGIIVGAVVLVPLLGPAGLAWGVVLGAFLHMLVQLPSLRVSGFRYHFTFLAAWRDPDVRRVIRLMIPRTLGVAANQISLLVMTIFASTLASGSLAVFMFANNIQGVPLGLFGIAFSLAAFPALSLFAAKKNERDFFRTLSETMQRILFFVVPSSVFIIIFRAQFVRVILGTGHFDWNDTRLTFEVLKFLVISLFAQSLIPLFTRAFFALQDTKTPLYIALVSEATYIVLVPLLLPHYAVEGLAMAFSAGTMLNFLLLYLALRRRVAAWDDTRIVWPVGKILLAALVAGLVGQASKYAFALTVDQLDTFVKVFGQLCLGLTIGGTTFCLMAWQLKIPELKGMLRFLYTRILRQPETVALVEDHPEKGDW